MFFAFDGPNYSIYLMWLDIFLTKIDETHPGAKELLQKGGISEAHSLLPGTLSAANKTMEETFMKFANLQEGLVVSFICWEPIKDGVEQHQPEHNIKKNYWKCVGLLTVHDSLQQFLGNNFFLNLKTCLLAKIKARKRCPLVK